MAISSTLTTSFKKELLLGNHNFATNGDAYKLALYTSSATLGATTTSFTTTGQASGTGYSTGGSALTKVAPTNKGKKSSNPAISKEIVVIESNLSLALIPGSTAILARKFTKFLCVTVTPFGLPVDPEV